MLLLTTKFHVPAPQPQNLARLSLIEQLEFGVQKNNRLTLLVAPAGFGKTTLLGSWLALYSHRVAWLSLDENDTLLTRFLFYLVSTLQPHLPDIGAEILSFLQTEQEPPVELVLTALLNAAASLNETVVLVLEDYHLVNNLKTDAALTFLLDHLPPRMHLVISSREDPALPLSRLRARGQLNEIRAADLRFTPEEVTNFLEQFPDLNLSARQIGLLEERTEGWIAGLQLAVLSLKGQEDTDQFIASFSGSHRYIMDYLVDEVLTRQSEELRQFLLRTALLRRMNGELCALITGKPAEQAQQTLARIEANNLFIVPLDNERQWFRYHHLFSELLRFRFNRNYPTEIPELHRRASQWFEAQGFWDEAIYHVIQSQNVTELESLLAVALEDATRNNQVGLVLGWFETIPAQLIQQHPRLILYKSWVLALANQTVLSTDYAEQAKALLRADSPKLERGLLEAILAYNARLHLNIPSAIEHADNALNLIGAQASVVQNIMLMLLGQAKLLIPDFFEEGMELVKEALKVANRIENRFVLFNSLSTLVFVLIGQARIREAVLLLDQFDKRYDKSSTAKIQTNLAWIPSLRATIYYLTNDLEKAQQELAKIIKDEKLDGLAWSGNAWAYMVQALISWAIGQPEKALTIFRRIEASQLALPPTIRATPYKISLLLQSGDLEEATLWVKEMGFSPTDPIAPEKDDYYLCYVRILTTQKRYEDALLVLKTLEDLASSLDTYYRLATVHILQAIVYLKSQRRSLARECLTKAILLMAGPQLFRTFLDEDPIITDLLLEVRPTAPKFVDELLAMYRQPKVVASPLIEPLSEREQEILGLIAQGLSNREIGERLVLAIGTVKRHAVNIFGKLEVNSRTEAVARAGELGLL